MKNKMFIPEGIHVGYRNRQDTYTGKLGYIIYTDNRGVKRKQTSWDGWRDKKIPDTDHSNEPTSGFVLNRNGGGGRGWDGRNEFIRVYDPRGFEFEISLANLLFILQETSSVKGKGLEGEFVYAWDGTVLVLLPVGSQEYKDCKSFTGLQDGKVTAKDMVVGCEYITKKGENIVYLGRGNYFEGGNYGQDKDCVGKVVRNHIYADTKDHKRFFHKSGFTHLAKKVSDDEYGAYAEILENLQETNHFKDVGELAFEEEIRTYEKTSGYSKITQQAHIAFKKVDDNNYQAFKIRQYYGGHYGRHTINYVSHFADVTLDSKGNIKFTNTYREYWREKQGFVEEAPSLDKFPSGYGSLYLTLSDNTKLAV